MSDKQIRQQLKLLQQQIAALNDTPAAPATEDIIVALEELQLICEEMQTGLEAAEIVEAGLLQQNQRIVDSYQHYYDLFHAAPIAYLVTDANGLILEANAAIAQLLNLPESYLPGKPLVNFVAEDDRFLFRTQLNQLVQANPVRSWQITLEPRGEYLPFVAALIVRNVRNEAGEIEALRIGVFPVSLFPQSTPQPIQPVDRQRIEERPLPQSLDGLQVLIVDDEADVRDITTALELHGVRVTAVATAAAALERLEQFHPDVLVSDIRMPDEDGYSLIRKVRELEARWGGHIPAAALTADLNEDRDKALAAGFEAHLHKLAQPSELVEVVAQLANRHAT